MYDLANRQRLYAQGSKHDEVLWISITFKGFPKMNAAYIFLIVSDIFKWNNINYIIYGLSSHIINSHSNKPSDIFKC